MSSCCNVTKAWTKTHDKNPGGFLENPWTFREVFVPWLFPYQSKCWETPEETEENEENPWIFPNLRFGWEMLGNFQGNWGETTSLKVDITIFFEQGGATPTHPRKCNSHLSYHLLCFCAKPLAADDIPAGWSFVKTGIGSWWIMFLIKNHISNQMSSNLCFHFK